MTRRKMLLRGLTASALILAILVVSARTKADSGMCGGATITIPFTDVGNSFFFCQIAAAYFSGLTNGTSATTYTPDAGVTREQMAAFITRTLDQSIKRGSRRAALNQWWTTDPHYDIGLGTTSLGFCSLGGGIASDGTDIWVAGNTCGSGGIVGRVSRVRASDGKLLENWTGADTGVDIVVAMGRIFIVGLDVPTGRLYMIDPTQPSGIITTVTSSLGPNSRGLAFDGSRFWTVNEGGQVTSDFENVQGSISIVTPGPSLPWAVTTISEGFLHPLNITFDGNNIWVTDSDGSLKKLDSNGAILQTVGTGATAKPVFDGTNLWIPGPGNQVSVIRASTGTAIATLRDNGLAGPRYAAFDGQRILVTNVTNVSIWKAADLSPIGSYSTGQNITAFAVCSDGNNFWINGSGPTGGLLLRF